MSDLNQAIQMIRQGRKTEAQQILQNVIKADPKNIQAWFWYVETCSTTDQRIQALEACLKVNPGNPQVTQALQQFRGMQTLAPAPVQPEPEKPAAPVYSYQEEEPEPRTNDNLYGSDSWRSNSYDSNSYEPAQNSAYLYEEEKPAALYQDDFNSYESFRSEPEPVKSAPKPKQSWETGPSDYVDNSMLSKPKGVIRTYSDFDVWLTALTAQDEKSYADLLHDPEMGLGRAFTWMAIAGVISALTLPIQLIITPDFAALLETPEVRQLVGGNVNQVALLIMITIIAVITSPISAILSVAINGGIQHFLSLFFGGGGNYTRTVYALSAFLAPTTVITSLLVLVPVVGSCLSFPIAIYNFVLNIRALKAAHSLTNGAAIGVVLAPAFLVFMIACLIVFMTATSLPS